MKLKFCEKEYNLYWRYEKEGNDINSAECILVDIENQKEYIGESKRHHSDKSNKELARKLSFWQMAKMVQEDDDILAHALVNWFIHNRNSRYEIYSNVSAAQFLKSKSSGNPNRLVFKNKINGELKDKK